MPETCSVSPKAWAIGGIANIATRPIRLTVATVRTSSSSSASIRGAVAMIALLPQIAVPTPKSSCVFRDRPRARAQKIPSPSAAAIASSVMASPPTPTRGSARTPRSNPAPTKTIARGMAVLMMLREPPFQGEFFGSTLPTTTPTSIARIAAEGIAAGRSVPSRRKSTST